ncbi:MAG: ATP synthase F1 subunit delta [Planctomycetota bacterium]
MNVAVDTVTARYAEALYDLARKHGKLEAVVSDVQLLAAEFDNPKVRSLLLNPRFSKEVRLEKLKTVLERCDELVRNFVHLLYDRNREQVLSALGAAFKTRRLAEAGSVEGVVESARRLGDAELADLRQGLKARFGLEVLLENVVDPDLIGGVRIRIGSKMIDQTVKGRLEGMRERLERAPLAGIGSSGA